MKLSIIIPIYNLENYIANTLDSILRIRFNYEYEIIVVNDGSLDCSLQIVTGYINKYDCISLIDIKNNGVSNARNVGIRVATGEYITFIDGDDTVNPEFFDYAVKEADEHGYDFVQGNYKVIEDTKEYFDQYQAVNIIYNNNIEMLYGLFGKNKTIHNSVWGKVYKREAICGVFFDTTLKIAEDQKFVFDVIQKSSSALVSNMHAYNYYQRVSSAMHKVDENREYDKLSALSYYRTQIDNDGLKKLVEWRETRILIYLLSITTRDKDKKEDIYKKLKKHRLFDIWSFLSTKERIKYIILRYFRVVYDLYYCNKDR